VSGGTGESRGRKGSQAAQAEPAEPARNIVGAACRLCNAGVIIRLKRAADERAGGLTVHGGSNSAKRRNRANSAMRRGRYVWLWQWFAAANPAIGNRSRAPAAQAVQAFAKCQGACYKKTGSRRLPVL